MDKKIHNVNCVEQRLILLVYRKYWEEIYQIFSK